MANEIWAIAEHRDGKIKPVTWEAIAAAQRLASGLGMAAAAVVLGKNVQGMAEEIAGKRLRRVLAAEHELLADYTPEGYVRALKQIIAKHSPHTVVITHSYQGAEFAPRLGAALGKAVITSCVGYEREGGSLVFIRPIFGAKLHMKTSFRSGPPYIVTFQTGAFLSDEAEAGDGRAEIELVGVELAPGDVARKIIELRGATKDRVDLSQAEIIVAAGRGIGGQEKLQMIFELAEALGGAVAASRPVVDNEWLPREYQIGSSGQTVSPKLYIACGISGAVQHLVGMQNSRCIVAINKDPNAPIFKIATYGIVGDLHQVVPALIKQIKESRQT